MRPITTRDQAIAAIAVTFPTDSGYAKIDQAGRELLQQARIEVLGDDWRSESTEVLLRYAELCRDKYVKIGGSSK